MKMKDGSEEQGGGPSSVKLIGKLHALQFDAVWGDPSRIVGLCGRRLAEHGMIHIVTAVDDDIPRFFSRMLPSCS
jgi:hypothetical protein